MKIFRLSSFKSVLPNFFCWILFGIIAMFAYTAIDTFYFIKILCDY